MTSCRKRPLVQVVVGLGNRMFPRTRHSVGMMLADALVEHVTRNPVFHKRRDLAAELCDVAMGDGTKLFIVKPMTPMNNNGRSVRKVLDSFHLPPSSLLLLHDDVDRLLGQWSFKASGSAGGHKGVHSIHTSLRTQELPRFRIGIGRPPQGGDVSNWVLEPFSPSDLDVLKAMVFPSIITEILNRQG